MSGFQDLKDLFRRRLLAAAHRDLTGPTTTSGYEEELHTQRNLLDGMLTPEIKLHRADVQLLSVIKEEQQEDSESPRMKEEQEEEEDTTKFPVKCEDDEDEAQSSLLHPRLTEEMETGADGEDCGGPGPDRNSDPEAHLGPMREVKTEETNKHPSSLDSNVNDKRRMTDCGPSTHLRVPAVEKPFRCSVCGKRFEQNAQLETHMIIHTGGKRFSCPECGHRYKYQGHLAAHMQVHTGRDPYSCTDCGKRLSTNDSLTVHKRSHSGEKPFSCYECGKTFNRKGSLARHMLVHSGEKPFSCSVCCRRFNRKWHLTRHMLVHGAEKPFSCSECSLRFNSESGLTLHMTFHRGEKPYSFTAGEKRAPQLNSQPKTVPCVGGQEAERRQNGTEEREEDCGGAEPSRNSEPEIYPQAEVEVTLEDSSGSETEDSEDDRRETGDRRSWLNSLRHQDVTQSTSDQKQTLCSQSEDTLNSTRSLKIHGGTGEKVHEEDPESAHIKEEQEEVWIGQADTNKFPPAPVKSEDDEEEPQSSQLHRRQTEQMETDGEDCGGPGPDSNSDPEACSGQESKDINSAENNEDKNPNSEEVSHSCSECGKTFKNKQSLTIHRAVHTGEKPFCCSECGRRFNRKGSLTRHMLLYRGEKPFSCSVCSKRFSRKWHLTRHVLVHEAEKPFNCSVCSVRFNKESGLTLHMAFHRGEKPYSCSV